MTRGALVNCRPGLKWDTGTDDSRHAMLLIVIGALLVASAGLALRRMTADAALAQRSKALDAAARAASSENVQLQQMLHFARQLGAVVSLDALRHILSETLPSLVGAQDFWISTIPNQWDFVVGPSGAPAAATQFPVTSAQGGPWQMFPMTSGTEVVGLIAVRQNPAAFKPSELQALEQIAAIIGTGIKNARLFHTAQEQSAIDSLTGCAVKRHGLALFESELRRARRSGTALSAVMLDLDHFKKLNDAYGHLAGDRALTAVGQLLREGLRLSDIRCRFGGEEFLLVLPETLLAAAARVAETLRHGIAALEIHHGGHRIPVTASFGVVELPPGTSDVMTYIELADAALYQAKAAGRNCVVQSNSPDGIADIVPIVRRSGAQMAAPFAIQRH